MLTPKFWQTVDRLGGSGAALAVWRQELDGDLNAALPFLHRLPGVADRIRDPDDPRGVRWMEVYPTDSEDVYMASSEDSPAHRTPFEIPASDLTRLIPDWDAIRPALAAALGFTAISMSAPHDTCIRQVGFVQPKIGITLPVFLFIPMGAFSDYQAFLTGMLGLPECVLYAPTSRFLAPETFAIANQRGIAMESMVDRLSQAIPAATSLGVASGLTASGRKSSKRNSEPQAILVVQPGWAWEKLQIRLSEKGTLVAQYGSARGEYRFGRKVGPEGQPKYPALFKILFRMCAAGRWENPPRADKTYAATQRNFARLRDLLQKLIRIDGDPFRKTDGAWVPRFQFEPDRELAAMLDYQTRKQTSAPRSLLRNARPFADEPEDDDSD